MIKFLLAVAVLALAMLAVVIWVGLTFGLVERSTVTDPKSMVILLAIAGMFSTFVVAQFAGGDGRRSRR